MQVELGGIVLAGGRSSRMGREKALLEWDGEPLVRRVIRRLQRVCLEVLVVTSSDAVQAAVPDRTVADEQPGLGPVGGLLTGLRKSLQEYNCVVACDMPWVNPNLFRHLAPQILGYDAVALHRDSGWEPLHALYARRCIPLLEECLAQGIGKLTEVCERLQVRRVTESQWRRWDPELQALCNLNTPEDYAHALQEKERLKR